MPDVFLAWDTAVDRVRSALTRSSVEVDFEGEHRGEPLPKRSPRFWAGMCGAVARLAHRLGGIAQPGPLPCHAKRTHALEYDRIQYGGLPDPRHRYQAAYQRFSVRFPSAAPEILIAQAADDRLPLQTADQQVT
jgi:hypothetical protein